MSVCDGLWAGRKGAPTLEELDWPCICVRGLNVTFRGALDVFGRDVEIKPDGDSRRPRRGAASDVCVAMSGGPAVLTDVRELEGVIAGTI